MTEVTTQSRWQGVRVQIDPRTDLREVIGEVEELPTGSVVLIDPYPLIGWGQWTHTVWVKDEFGDLVAFHARPIDEE